MLPNTDQLTVFLGIFFAVLLLITISGLIYLWRYRTGERKKWVVWREFAALNELSFKAGTFPTGAPVSGTVAGYSVSLRSVYYWRPFNSRANTRLLIAARLAICKP